MNLQYILNKWWWTMTREKKSTMRCLAKKHLWCDVMVLLSTAYLKGGWGYLVSVPVASGDIVMFHLVRYFLTNLTYFDKHYVLGLLYIENILFQWNITNIKSFQITSNIQQCQHNFKNKTGLYKIHVENKTIFNCHVLKTINLKNKKSSNQQNFTPIDPDIHKFWHPQILKFSSFEITIFSNCLCFETNWICQKKCCTLTILYFCKNHANNWISKNK